MKKSLVSAQRAGHVDKLAKCFKVWFYVCLLFDVVLAIALIFYPAFLLFGAFFLGVVITFVVKWLVCHYKIKAETLYL